MNPRPPGRVCPGMTRRLLTLPILAAACSGGSAPAGPVGPPPPAYDFAAVDAAIQTTVDTTDFVTGAAILLVQRGHVIHERGFGDMTVDSEVKIASASKWLTAAVVLDLVADGELSLDGPIGPHIESFRQGFWREELGEITPRMLLSQTSGFKISHPCMFTAHKTLDQCARDIASFALMVAPGQGFVYGEGQWTVAGATAEGATGRPWAELFRRALGDPLALERTFYQGGQNPILGDGAISTVREYTRFLEAIHSGGVYRGRRVLPASLVEEMLSDQVGSKPIVFSPRDPALHYGLGVWRDRAGPAGEPLAVSGPGSLGFWPFIDFERELWGVVAIPPHLVWSGGTIGEVLRLVREAVPTS